MADEVLSLQQLLYESWEIMILSIYIVRFPARKQIILVQNGILKLNSPDEKWMEGNN
jgi:hypothetical protein